MMPFQLAKACAVCLALALQCACGNPSNRSDAFDAISEGDLDTVAQLMTEQPLLRDAYLRDGWTALTIAAASGDLEMVRLLVDLGCDVNKQEGGRNPPIFWAAYYGHAEIAKLLLENGADGNQSCEDCRSALEVATEKGDRQMIEILSTAREK